MNDLLSSDEEAEPQDDTASTSEIVPKLEENETEEMEIDNDLLAELTKGGIKQSEALEAETVDGMDLKGVERVGKVIKLHGSKLLRETLSVCRHCQIQRMREGLLMESENVDDRGLYQERRQYRQRARGRQRGVRAHRQLE